MIAALADTHTAVWYVFQNARLSVVAREKIEAISNEGNHVGVSSISVAEMVYPVEKGRIENSAVKKLVSAFSDPSNVLQEVPLDARIAEHMTSVPRDQVPDLPDRIIAATAHYLNIPLISRDGKIRASAVQTVW